MLKIKEEREVMAEKQNVTDTKKETSFLTRPQWLPDVAGFRKSRLLSEQRPKTIGTLLLLAACLGLGFGGGWLGARTYNNAPTSGTSRAAQQKIISNESELISSIAKDVGKSVVSIETASQTTATDIFGFSVPSTRASAGTGFVVSEDGVIVTNRHVIPEGEPEITVTMADGTRYSDVKIIGRTASSSPLDVAFLKINDLKGKKPTAVKLGDSAAMEVGYKVVAIGNALGQFKNTVTSGIISGYGRDVTAADSSGSSPENLSDLFQTDAAINEGNSGGPLVNINSEVIGINTAVAANAQNIGFAIPINDIKGLIDSVLKTGELKQPYLGVRYVSLTDDLAYYYNLDVKRGAYILPSTTGSSSIIPGSPAEKAGLREKDIIAKVNDILIDDKTSLTSALSRFKVGDMVSLTVVRDGKSITLQVTLEEIPGS